MTITLSMYIDKGDYHDGIVSFLGLQYDNGDIKQCYSQKVRVNLSPIWMN